MTTDGQQETSARSDVQLKFIGFLLAVSLTILGWGFNNWSDAVEQGMAQVMQKLTRIESRAETRDERIYEIAQEVRVLSERHLILKERVDKHEGHP